jgi:hypothetical protein
LRRLVVTAIIIVGVIGGAVGAGASVASKGSRHKIIGTLTLTTSTGLNGDSKDCSAPSDSGFSDIVFGALVTVRDESDKIIAKSRLGHGHRASGTAAAVQCTFPFSVSVPDTSFYAIEISHRGGANYSRSDLAHMHWHVALDLSSTS